MEAAGLSYHEDDLGGSGGDGAMQLMAFTRLFCQVASDIKDRLVRSCAVLASR